MKKRKKRRSKTEGGDKLPFDDEMGKNQKAIKVLQRLFDAGYGTEKEIVNMAMDEMLALPGVNVADLCIISELQKSIKANKVISYLSGGAIFLDVSFHKDIPYTRCCTFCENLLLFNQTIVSALNSVKLAVDQIQ